MTFSIAVSGKGGTGKTTFAALMIETLRRQGLGPILAVDADPNATLGIHLGIDCNCTVSDILEETKGLRNLPDGVSKPTHLEYQLQRVLVESTNVDLLVMGHPEGPDCYCTANHILRSYMDALTKNYKYIVIDNEAGMEHLNRKTTQNIDSLFIISDATRIGIKTARNIKELIDKLTFLNIKSRYLVLNKANENMVSVNVGAGLVYTERSERVPARPADLGKEIKEIGIPLIGKLPFEEALIKLELAEKPISSLSNNSPILKAIDEIINQIGVK